MISLVLVSHSHQLVCGLKEMADQMADHKVAIRAVGGLLEDDGVYQLGTDATRIVVAIEETWSEAGVLLFVDLGSAVLSAELAIELLPPEMQPRCIVSNAPLVEGTIVAALEASLGNSLEAVNRAAEAVLHQPKVV